MYNVCVSECEICVCVRIAECMCTCVRVYVCTSGHCFPSRVYVSLNTARQREHIAPLLGGVWVCVKKCERVCVRVCVCVCVCVFANTFVCRILKIFNFSLCEKTGKIFSPSRDIINKLINAT